MRLCWVNEFYVLWRSLCLPGGFPIGSDGKESVCRVEDLGLIPGLERSPGEEHSNPLQYSCLQNPHGQRSLARYRPWGHKKSDMTEPLSLFMAVWWREDDVRMKEEMLRSFCVICGNGMTHKLYLIPHRLMAPLYSQDKCFIRRVTVPYPNRNLLLRVLFCQEQRT